MSRAVKYLLLLLLFPANSSRAQQVLQQYVPIPPQELSVQQFLYHIEQATEVPLAYSSAIVPERKYRLPDEQMLLRKLLDTLFYGQDIQYYLYDGQLILAPLVQVNARGKNLISISGVVRSGKTQKVIPYANVFIPYQTTGTITNSEGRFNFFIPMDLGVDSIVVSCLGYYQQSISIEKFLVNSVEIQLEPQKFQINELIVRPHDPYNLLYLALEKKEQNYASHPELLTAFIRETTRQNDQYISLSEAVIDIYKTPYLSNENDLIKLKKGRKEHSLVDDQEINLVVEGGLYNTLQLDIIKYGVNFLNTEFMQYYEYEFLRQQMYNGRQTYSIAFHFKEPRDFIGFDGVIYLDAISLAVVRAEFQIDPRSLALAYTWLIKRAPKEYRVAPRYGSYVVEYRQYDAIWNLYYARSEVSLKLRKRRKDENGNKVTSQHNFATEFVITGKTDENFDKIRYRDAAKPNEVLYEQITATDNEFWGTETVIVPEEPLQETIQKLWVANPERTRNLIAPDVAQPN